MFTMLERLGETEWPQETEFNLWNCLKDNKKYYLDLPGLMTPCNISSWENACHWAPNSGKRWRRPNSCTVLGWVKHKLSLQKRHTKQRHWIISCKMVAPLKITSIIDQPLHTRHPHTRVVRRLPLRNLRKTVMAAANWWFPFMLDRNSSSFAWDPSCGRSMATLELLLFVALDARILFAFKWALLTTWSCLKKLKASHCIEDLFKHHPSCINHMQQKNLENLDICLTHQWKTVYLSLISNVPAAHGNNHLLSDSNFSRDLCSCSRFILMILLYTMLFTRDEAFVLPQNCKSSSILNSEFSHGAGLWHHKALSPQPIEWYSVPPWSSKIEELTFHIWRYQ